MEEDLKILEENIKDGTVYVRCGFTFNKALENLIKRYKELEEENENLEEQRDSLVDEYEEREKYTHGLEEKIKNSIQKSKIKEIRDKAEVMDYYTLPNVIDDLNELLGENNHCICTKCTNKKCVHHKCKLDCVFDAEDSYECCDGFLKKGDCSSFIESEENK